MLYFFLFLFLSSFIFFIDISFLFSFFVIGFVFFFLFGPNYLCSFFFFDFFSWGFVCLTFFIVILMYLSVFFFLNFEFELTSFLFLFLLIFMFLCYMFSLTSAFFFFFIFECCVLPIFVIILGWGFSSERLTAGFYMFMYTFVFSLPFLLALFFISLSFGFMDFLLFYFIYNIWGNLIMVFFLTFVFFVKLPLYNFHIWLPKAHVEAPLAGSMILAGVLLKMGGYGLLRFFFFYLNYDLFLFFFLFFGLMGGLYSAVICFSQVDMKCMVAYMSVSHMGLMFSSFFSSKVFGFFGFFLMMLAHGLSSSGLFSLIGFFYDRFYSRSMFFMKGGMHFFGPLSFWFFILICGNMSCPPTMNFFSELFMSWGLFSLFFPLAFFFGLLMLLGCFYTVHFFLIFFHGESFFYLDSSCLFVFESFLFFLHAYPMLFFFFFFG